MKKVQVFFPNLLKNDERDSFELACNLRVAYKVQGYNNHKPYLEIFESLDKMLIEHQIDIVYAAFSCGHPEYVKDVGRQYFQDYMLENYDVKGLMDIIKQITQGIMGISDEDIKEKESEGNQEAQE